LDQAAFPVCVPGCVSLHAKEVTYRQGRRAYPGAVLDHLALVVEFDVLGYGAFGPVTVLRDRTARLTRPTLDARFA